MDENNNNSQNSNIQNEQQTNENTELGTQKDSKAGQNDKKYSDADVNALIDRKFAEWQKKKDAELGEAKKLAEMDATQKAEYERDKMQKELDLLKKQNLINWEFLNIQKKKEPQQAICLIKFTIKQSKQEKEKL